MSTADDRIGRVEELLEANNRYLQEARDARAACAVLYSVLSTAADWFQGYADGHAAKGDTDKAQRNQNRADACRSSLSTAEGQS